MDPNDLSISNLINKSCSKYFASDSTNISLTTSKVSNEQQMNKNKEIYSSGVINENVIKKTNIESSVLMYDNSLHENFSTMNNQIIPEKFQTNINSYNQGVIYANVGISNSNQIQESGYNGQYQANEFYRNNNLQFGSDMNKNDSLLISFERNALNKENFNFNEKASHPEYVEYCPESNKSNSNLSSWDSELSLLEDFYLELYD